MEWITEVNWTATNRMKADVLADLYNFTDGSLLNLSMFNLNWTQIFI